MALHWKSVAWQRKMCYMFMYRLWRSRYPNHGQVTVFHRIMWDIITISIPLDIWSWCQIHHICISMSYGIECLWMIWSRFVKNACQIWDRRRVVIDSVAQFLFNRGVIIEACLFDICSRVNPANQWVGCFRLSMPHLDQCCARNVFYLLSMIRFTQVC